MFIKRTSPYTTRLALLFAICMVSSGATNQPSFTTIDVPGAINGTEAFGINAEGDIVGRCAGIAWRFRPTRRPSARPTRRARS